MQERWNQQKTSAHTQGAFNYLQSHAFSRAITSNTSGLESRLYIAKVGRQILSIFGEIPLDDGILGEVVKVLPGISIVSGKLDLLELVDLANHAVYQLEVA